jgi:rfaE bifunctional protein kinase chain/domain
MCSDRRMPNMNNVQLTDALKTHLLGQIPKLKGKKILIIGDVGLDEYILGEVRRISPEAPVPVLEVESEDLRLGLSANVAQNVSALGGTPVLISVVGHDSGADRLQELFRKHNVSTDYLIRDSERPTTRKIRVMAKHHHLVRVDYELKNYLSPEIEKKILERVDAVLPLVDAVVIEDYAKGVISSSLLKSVAEMARKAGKKTLADPHKTKATGAEFYSGIDLLKPNFDEAIALSGLKYEDVRWQPDQALEVARTLQKQTGAKEIVITRGKDGMLIVSGSQVVQVPTYAREVFDVTGAGDTVIAALSLGLSAGLPLTEACMLANFAAGVVVGQVGCVPCTVPELESYIRATLTN